MRFSGMLGPPNYRRACSVAFVPRRAEAIGWSRRPAQFGNAGLLSALSAHATSSKRRLLDPLERLTLRRCNPRLESVNDAQRAAKIVESAKGKRLMYRRPDESPMA